MARSDTNEVHKIPFCGACYDGWKRDTDGKDEPFDHVIHIRTEDVSKCVAALCTSHPENEALWTCSDPDGPMTSTAHCDCENEHVAAMHNELLWHVRKLYTCFGALMILLRVTKDVVKDFIANEKHKRIELGSPLHELLTSMMRFHGSCIHKLETPSGHALEMPTDPGRYHCHFGLISGLNDKDCGCTQGRCPGLTCAMRHVKHSADDYENVVLKARDNIVDLQEMRTNTAQKGVDVEEILSHVACVEACQAAYVKARSRAGSIDTAIVG